MGSATDLADDTDVSDPFGVLGLGGEATAAQIRAARRDLARQHHPDAGGDADVMRRLNVAAADALRAISERRDATLPPQNARPERSPDSTRAPGTATDAWEPTTRDVPSFTVDALPVETFEALLVACAELGEVEDDDPPYLLRTLLAAPVACWCQLDVVPDAGASTVSVSIAPVDGRPMPALIAVRNAWINALNGLDWSSL